MTVSAALAAFRRVYVAYIVYASGRTLLQAWHGDAHTHLRLALIALASLEIAAALAFLVARLERAACAMLLAIYAVAAVLTVAEGAVPAHLVYYAATALFIVKAGQSDRPVTA